MGDVVVKGQVGDVIMTVPEAVWVCGINLRTVGIGNISVCLAHT